MVQLEFEFALDDRASSYQGVKKANIRFRILGVGRCGGTTQHEDKPSDGKAHAVLLRLGCLASALLGNDAPVRRLLVKVIDEFVGAWLQGWHFELQGFAARNDLFDP